MNGGQPNYPNSLTNHEIVLEENLDFAIRILFSFIIFLV
jgi:hypothetical protein